MKSPAVLLLAMLIGNGLAQAPDVVIRSNAREVLLDVVVRDARGHLVTNLKPEDIAVYEDGVRQDVRAFRLVAGSEVRMEDERQAAEAKVARTQAAGTQANAEPPTKPPARPPLNPLRTVNVVCLILNDINAVDNDITGSSLVAPTRTFAFNAARKFIDNQLRPNTFIGIFTLDSSGLRPVYPFSNDRERLLKAAQLAAANQLPAVTVGSAAVLNGLSTQVGITGLGSRGDASDALGSQHDMTLAATAGLREIDALKGLVRQLAASPFHKTVLLISNGLTRPPDQLEYWDSLIHAATDGGVTFYALDPHALDPFYFPNALSSAALNYAASLSAQQGATSMERLSPPPGQIGNLGPPTLTIRTTEQSHQDDYVRFAVSSANPQEAIRELAERTGGFLIANTNNVDPLLAHVMEEVDTHYEIAYPPKAEREDGHFRKIEVKLARAGLRVETRTGYFAVPDTGAHPLTPEEMAGLRALDTQPRPHAFDFLSRVYRFRDSGGKGQYAIAFEMPISNLTATPQAAAHQRRLHASLLALVKNADGEIVDRVSKDVPSEVSDDHWDSVRVELMTYQRAVNLPPGRYTVETAVVDHEGNRASTGVVQIENRPEGGIGLSDLTLVRRVEDLAAPADPADPFEYANKRVLPFVTTHLLPGAQPFAYFVIYPQPGSAARMVLRVRLLKDGRPLTTLRPDVPAPDASGGIPLIVTLPTKPGAYEVRATITQGNRTTERTLTFTLAGS
jgi:VWFA-related protein